MQPKAAFDQPQALAGLIPVGIVGGSGYAGLELLRLIAGHPRMKLEWILSRSHADQEVASVYPSLLGVVEARFADPGNLSQLAQTARVVFLATPPGSAAELAPILLEAGCVVVDISADFRFKDAALYERVYGRPHPSPQLLAHAAYGLPELFKEAIVGSRLVANPGCYPTAALLALGPLAAAGFLDVERPVVISATSGISGAGSQPGAMYHYPAATENVRPYNVPGHRHTPEIAGYLTRLLPGAGRAGNGALGPQDAGVKVAFVPHLVPASRGILATCVAAVRREITTEALTAHYREFFASSPFVRVLQPPLLPETKRVQGSNFCDLAVRWDPDAGAVVAMAAIDNLVKGASGQAVQNVNLIMGWDEAEGLDGAPLYP